MATVKIKQIRRVYSGGGKTPAPEFRVIEHDEDVPMPAFSSVLEDQETPVSDWAPLEGEE